MLAKPTKAIGEVLDRFENKKFTCEYKYDGERAQVHKLEDGTIGVFSRNSEDMSKKYPDLMEQLPHVGHNDSGRRCDAETQRLLVYEGHCKVFCVRLGGCCHRQGHWEAHAFPGA